MLAEKEGKRMTLPNMVILYHFFIRVINDTKEDVTKMLRHIFVTS